MADQEGDEDAESKRLRKAAKRRVDVADGEEFQIDPVEAKKRRREARRLAAEGAGVAEETLETDSLQPQILRQKAKRAAGEAREIVEEQLDIDPSEAKRLKKEAKRVAKEVEEAPDDQLEAVLAKAKRLRKDARRAAAEATTAVEEDPTEAKRLRKEAKRAAAEAGVDAEVQPQTDPSEAKRLRREAKRADAAAAAATTAGEDLEVIPQEAKKKDKESKSVDVDCVETETDECGVSKVRSQTPTPGRTADLVESQGDQDALTVFVGGVPFRCESATLHKDFSECGEIVHMSMPLNDDGRPQGVAFITYKTREGVLAALKYNGEEYGTRILTVNIAGKTGARGTARGDPALEIFVKGFSSFTTDAEVREAFSACGEIQSFRMPKWPDGGSKGMAFITFQTSEGLAKALEQNGKQWGDRYLIVEKAVEGSGGGKGKGGTGKGSSKGGKGKSKGKLKS
eukprot:TRINITY_DN56164_c0_g1_i1.p1 TRINITY_DN56164_c0_g1~~TRINITY_DN56164_c0_g1_i1.p1  ORF type:complete len:484 (+),score=90.86 TRINITY_DN56164_c0_g1_i1:89-1453(+)